MNTIKRRKIFIWLVNAKFEKSSQEFSVTFDKAAGLIEGMDFGPAH